MHAACKRKSYLRGYAALVELVTPAHISLMITRDPADDVVLACALPAQADLIVSGEAHLLNLKHYHDMQIVTPAHAVQAIPAQ